MKWSKQEQKELMQVYDTWWYSYLNGDVKTYDSYFTDDYHFIGSTNGEEHLNRKDTTEFFEATADQMSGKAELRNQKRTIEELTGDIILITHLADVYVIGEPEWVFYSRFRFTSMLRKTSAGWRFFYQHFSAPDTKAQESETLGTEKITKENEELRDAIKRRTVELEHKNKELAIEASLERVRARTMAMQSSAELGDVATVLFSELNQVVDNLWTCGFVLCEKDRNEDEWWLSSDKGFTRGFYLPNVGDFTHATLYEGWKETESFRTVQLEGKELQQHYDWLMEMDIARKIFEDMDAAGIERPDWQKLHAAYFSRGYLCIITRVPCTEEEIFKRFAQVFDQTYTRFLDLQKAEAQAREAQIEVSLERVRSRAMIMHNSDELLEVGALLYKELSKLGIQNLVTGYTLMEDEGRMGYNYGVNPFDGTITPLPVGTKHTETKLLKSIAASWKKQEPLLVIQLNPEETIANQTYMAEETTNFPIPKEKLLAISPERLVVHTFNFTQGYLLIVGGTLLIDAQKEMVIRFAKVFEMTYTRFLDLQKAEAQAREAQIETALEKVRSRSLAMHKSDELGEVISVIVERLKDLGFFVDDGVALITFAEGTKDLVEWMTNPGFDSATNFNLPYFNHPVLSNLWAAKEKGQEFIFERYSADENKSFLNHIFEHSDFKHTPQQVREYCLAADTYATSIAFQKNTAIFINDYSGKNLTIHEIDILKRFSKVFEQSYTRFLDLTNAETLAHKAKIEVALERVRARALAMQQPEELKAVAEVLRHEMGLLGVEELETCSIYINDEAIQRTECWYALKDISEEKKKLVSDHFPLNLTDTWVGKEMLNFYQSDEKKVSIVMQGANRKEWIRYCEVKSVPFRGYYGEVIPDRTYHLYKFSHGAIGAAAAADISAESWDLLRRAASVFSLAYSRFKDLTQARTDLINLKEEKQKAEDALTNLKAAQSQLVQSEKMASLGELTAGIAHEIQNPLNFVNNFSEVSKELLDEMKEALEKGDTEDAREIMNDVIQNLEKINHHGKRADGIVKGMLQHSRSTSGVKEPTDINVLADEYLRLAYHGLRAKDKSFNASMKTDFDESLEKVNIIPQDMGRVILNLITNAFYVVKEKKKAGIEGYEPTVTISTKKTKDKVELRVSDNGNGIPKKVLDKIFQPFFTTKPTGQGTGLGLSLAYDIVTAHGGELKVETKEDEGSEFIIQLPVV